MAWMRPNSFITGSPKATNNPIAPTQKQHKRMHTPVMISQVLIFGGVEAGGGGAPIASVID
jgi:hypothetical protein